MGKSMIKRLLICALLAAMAFIQLPTMSAEAASSMENKSAGTVLFNNGEKDRLFVSETAYTLAPGIQEYVDYSNEPDGLNQNIDYFCEIDPSKAEIMTGYAGMENILEKNQINWQMQTVSGQVADTQSYFSRSKKYADYTIVAAMNADYYNMATGQPSGLLIIDGRTYNKSNGGYYFGIEKNTGKAVISNDSSNETLAKLSNATGGGSLLIKDGEVKVGKGGRNVTYSAIGIKADGTVVSMVCYGQSYPISCGYTQYEVALMMKARGCQTALLMDGSGSSTFVSRREGDKGSITRNHPSDGQERQVSSSLFFISKAKPDGVFSHAVVTPSNEVYTPGSTVDFSATGADKSGGPANLPDDLNWNVDSKYGSIDAASGKFVSNGETGDVKVSLLQGDQEVGSSTITIANPDEITFAEDSVSMGNGDTGDLGLRVYFKKREVHYKDGDLKWTITPTQYSRKEYVNSTYNYHYKGTNGTVRTDAHPKGTTITMAPPTQLLDHNDKRTGGWGIGDLKGVANKWVGDGLASNYAEEGWVLVKHNFKTVTENSADQCSKLSVGSVSDNKLTIDPVYSGKDLSVPDHKLTNTEKMATAITATVTVTSAKSPSVSGNVTLNACKDPVVAMDVEGNNQNVFNGLTSGGVSDFFGTFKDGTYTPFTSVKNETDLKDEGYDYVCVSYLDRQTGNPQIGKASVVSRTDGYPVRFGDYSLKVDYDIPGNPHQNDGICFGPTEEIDLSKKGNPSKIGIWVYIPKNTPNLWLRLRYKDGSGNTSQLDFTENDIYSANSIARNADDGWHYFEADISKLQTPVTIPAGMAVRIMYSPAKQSGRNAAKAWASPVGWVKCQTDSNGNIILADRSDSKLTNYGMKWGDSTQSVNITTAPPASAGSKLPIPEYLAEFNSDGTCKTTKPNKGTLYFDNLTFVYGSTTEDKDNPTVDSVLVNQSEELQTNQTFNNNSIDIQATYSDNNGQVKSGVDYAALYVDGRKIDCISSTSELRAGLKLSNGNHTIKLSVVDKYGNEATKTYVIKVNDPEGTGAPVKVSSREASAVLGKTVTLNFVPRDNSIKNLEAEIKLSGDFSNNYQITDASGKTIEGTYDKAKNALSFKASGAVDNGPMATVVLTVPTDAKVGTNLTCNVSGTGDGTSFSDDLVLPVTAPYTLKSGEMISGIDDTCYFTITHSATGEPSLGVSLYQGTTLLGTSDVDGKVNVAQFLKEKGDINTLTVVAKDQEGGVSSPYTVAINTIQGSEDGKPTEVWRNSADSTTGLNVGWFANPSHAKNKAELRVSENNDDLANGTVYKGACRLTTFSTDHSSVYVCGAKANDLKPGTTYYYQVGDGENWSEAKSFTTGYANTGTKALIFGDLQESNNTTLSGILKQLNVNDYDLTIQTGDLVDNGGNYGYWKNTLKMLDPISSARLFAIGNHEQDGGLDPNKIIYNQGNSNYYSNQYGNLFVATLAFNGFDADSLNQLVRDANASNATWKILVMHQPVYYTNQVAGMSSYQQKTLYEAIQKSGIDVVFAGHDHAYARTEPLYEGSVDEEKGVTYYICGSLGEKAYSITDNPDFHFAKLDGKYNAVYLTLSTTSDTLTVNSYDYKDGKSESIDSFVKKKNSDHTHEFSWDGKDRLTCNKCGYTTDSSSYTGYVDYEVGGKAGKAYLNAGKLMTGVFAVGEDKVEHAGEDGLLHNTETINTAQCWEDGYLGCWCKDDNKFYQLSVKRRQGHQYDENHVCTRKVFDVKTFTWHICGYHGKDISTLDTSLAYNYGYYNGKEKRPAVTIKDGDYTLFGQSTYGDFMPYWDNNVNVGEATVRIVGYADGPYYGENTLHFQIVPQNLSANDITATTTGNSVKLSWKAAPGAKKYIIYQKDGTDLTRLDVTDKTEYTITGLDSGDYEFCLRPFAEVDGKEYYSTKYSDSVKVSLDTPSVSFKEGSKITCSYGDDSFVNEAVFTDGAKDCSYTIDNKDVAEVDAKSGEVTIKGTGKAIVTAQSGDITGQYQLVVKPREAKLQWSGIEDLTYNGKQANVTAEITNLVNGDNCTVTVEGGNETHAGTYTATATELGNSNYALPEENSVEYTIAPAVITGLTWGNTETTYTGNAVAPTVLGGNGIVDGDTVDYDVPQVSETGTYKLQATSKNKDYVISEDEPACEFVISEPAVSAIGGNDGDVVSCYLKDGTIYVSGNVQSSATISVQAKGAEGSTYTATVTPGVDGSVSAGSVTYPVNAEHLAKASANVKFIEGTTKTPEGNEPDDNIGESGMSGLAASVAAEKDKLAGQVEIGGETDPETEIQINLYAVISLVEHNEGQSYKVEIKPGYTISVNNEEKTSGILDNSYLTAPVEVKLQIPSDIVIGKSTFIKHYLENGDLEYIRPNPINGNVLSFFVDSFSQFEVVSDTRSAEITFNTDSGKITRVYGPDNIGDALPSSGNNSSGWKIGDGTYTTFTEELLDSLNGQGKIEATSAEETKPEEPPKPSRPSGGGGGGSAPQTYINEVKSTQNGTVRVTPTMPSENQTVTITATPEEGYEVEKVVVADKNGNVIKNTKKGEGTYTFIQPGEEVTITVTFKKEGTKDGTPKFTDVPALGDLADAVNYGVSKGFINGTSDTTFTPNGEVTRAQFAAFLYRLDGSHKVSTTAPFKDISGNLGGEDFLDAINWAAANGIIKGVDDTHFEPLATVTREQATAMLHRYEKGLTKTGSNTFTDVKSGAWYEDDINWGVANGIIQGYSDTTFGVGDNTTRGQAVQFIYRAEKQ